MVLALDEAGTRHDRKPWIVAKARVSLSPLTLIECIASGVHELPRFTAVKA